LQEQSPPLLPAELQQGSLSLEARPETALHTPAMADGDDPSALAAFGCAGALPTGADAVVEGQEAATDQPLPATATAPAMSTAPTDNCP
ncbi:MAG TPA: hypothetical protein VK570_01690, partial [Rubrivivax sp.]|nr:hypothetical protein [Rubrivivax sp.]